MAIMGTGARGGAGHRLAIAAVAACILAACEGPAPDAQEPVAQATDTESAGRPNILLIVVDDMGFTDLGSFGGEIPTPNLDRLALDGLRFTNFHVASTCSPTRAMLFSGVDSHLAGLGSMNEEMSPNQRGQPGYEGRLNERVVAFTELLADGGYRNYMAGKWHLGTGEVSGPENRGFHRSFMLAPGGASHFADMRPVDTPNPEVVAPYFEDGVKLQRLPADFTYSSQFYADRMIDYLGDHDSSQPFFAYLSFTAPHWPIQAPDEALARHAGRYDEGYDVVAERRLANLRTLGLLPDSAVRAERSPKEVPFDQLDPEQREVEIRAMEVYAAMIDEVDVHTGRLLDFMSSRGLLDNTLVLFMSDNGAEGHDFDETWPMDAYPDIRLALEEAHDFSYENMGRQGSYTLLGPNWANATSPAFRLHKAFPTEGGTRVTAFASFPGRIEAPAIVDDLVYVTDIAPTILDLAGVEHPGTRYRERAVEPLSGRSFVPVLDGAEIEDRVVVMELFGKRAVRQEPWKMVHVPAPHGSGDWQLYNIREDIAEANDLAAERPDKLAELKAMWEDYAERTGLILPDWVSGY